MMQPTLRPTMIPTERPSRNPTKNPSTSPSSQPTLLPTTAPVIQASNMTVLLPPVSPTGNNNSCQLFQLDIVTDSHPTETLWKLEQISGQNVGIVGMGPPPGHWYSNGTLYTGAALGCLELGSAYEFSIYGMHLYLLLAFFLLLFYCH